MFIINSNTDDVDIPSDICLLLSILQMMLIFILIICLLLIPWQTALRSPWITMPGSRMRGPVLMKTVFRSTLTLTPDGLIKHATTPLRTLYVNVCVQHPRNVYVNVCITHQHTSYVNVHVCVTDFQAGRHKE